MHWWDGTWHWSMMLGMAVFWILIIGAIIWGIRAVTVSSGTGRAESAEDILKRRFASGDITQQEYEERLKQLRK